MSLMYNFSFHAYGYTESKQLLVNFMVGISNSLLYAYIKHNMSCHFTGYVVSDQGALGKIISIIQ